MRILLTDTTWAMAILAKKLRDAGFFVTEAGDVAELLEFARNGQQDAVVIDPDLPSGTLPDLLRQLRAAHAQMPLCIHTRDMDKADRLRAMTCGADDIFDNAMTMEEIEARLRAYVRRASGFGSPVVKVGDLSVDLDRQSVHLNDMPIHLTRLEYELIETMCLRNGKLITREEIMLQLYAWQDEPDAKIIDVYICRIRAKLAAAGATDDVIMTSFAQGYRLNTRPAEVLPAAA
ncbi:response regulator transcription factor [Pseudooceanicola sp. MF1-13]|uniref:response regulator transcription factor n=1 Tax=Pseudooceanicola sp. MF1-13 TaxID=3379095 RepID=UPI0038924614